MSTVLPCFALPLTLSCAAELLQQMAPGSVDAVVAIGGDGTMHEVLQVRVCKVVPTAGASIGRTDLASTALTLFAQTACALTACPPPLPCLCTAAGHAGAAGLGSHGTHPLCADSLRQRQCSGCFCRHVDSAHSAARSHQGAEAGHGHCVRWACFAPDLPVTAIGAAASADRCCDKRCEVEGEGPQPALLLYDFTCTFMQPERPLTTATVAAVRAGPS